ncbi:uncharacterized protein BXZ73DRAFT_102515 [Epithele typhae]|uniref:uncharacterized protein n=1 Tax=Epithele typhae TaxID=378194 RepID=UPI00200737FF|nr:uncharacterized protein BXZ73DRAFT_102515 [Epithele typhae]KAH9928009.1 hypothetical protein BXZ73DRAFT_102515 [Epithele typhae]
MMSRVVLFLFGLLSLLAGSQIHAAPVAEIVARQTGNLQCNLDRLSIVSSVKNLQDTLSQIASSDSSTADAVAAVQSDVSDAQGGIATIAQALVAGQAAPASARDVVKQGLVSAGTDLAAVTSSDAATTKLITKAGTLLTKAGQAGEGVVSNCK